ncbi:MAG: FecR family protein [Dysgonamonadaceae bacterium]|jgi:ferric-dicitrate binding protein FerR (iron transport regulator)|nr:FecR family protein [Dysgonamonadaceae bacterium]
MKQMNAINTDEAWKVLYNRLKQEDLIPEEKTAHRIQPWNLAAAILLLCLLTGTGIFMLSDKQKNNLLSKTNNDVGTTLVTTLEDGSIVYLAGQTSVYYPPLFSGDERRVKIEGDALFDVRKEPERPFLVETKHILVKVHGTTFRIHTNKGNFPFELSVKHGLVEITKKSDGKSILASTGETVSLEGGNLVKKDTEGEFTQFTSTMKFKDEPLENILKVLKENSGTNIVLESEDLKNQVLTVTFKNQSVNSMVKTICIALNLSFAEKSDGIFIYKP